MAQCFHSAMKCVILEMRVAKEQLPSSAAPFLSSSFLPCRSSLKLPPHHQRPVPVPRLRLRLRLPPVRAIEFDDQDKIVAVAVGLAGIAFGIAVPVFYEAQMKGAESRGNDQPCFPCAGSGAQTCRFCLGAGNVTVELSGGVKEVSKCVNCEGAGSVTCTTCQGSGIQPRYLDRREFKDDD